MPRFFFEVVGVHDAVGEGFVRAEGAALAEHGVNEGGLAVVDVGDDGNVEDGLEGDGGRCTHGGVFLSGLKLNLMARWRENPAGAGDGAEGENARPF